MKLNELKGLAATAGMAVSIAALSAGFAHAQELEELVVTARGSGENVQSVPLAITAFSANDLEKRAVVDMKDVSRLTPGFAFEDYGGSGATSPVIRGTTQIAGSTEQPVSFFLDGVYLPRSYVTDIGFWGIERLEVVKGPQSARYGRNAFSGAVNYVTRQPTNDYHAEVQGTVGNYDRYDGAALISGPIIKDKISIIGGFNYSTFDGAWKNTHPFCNADLGNLGTDCRLGGWEKTTWNAGIKITPTDKITLTGTYFNVRNHREQAAVTYFGELNSNSSLLNCGQFNPNVRPAGSGTGGGGQWFRLYCGELPVNPLAVDPRAYASQLKADIYRVGLDVQITDDLKFSYVYGRVSARNRLNQYNDQIPGCTYFIPGACVFSGVGQSTNLTQSHDARLNWDSGGAVKFALGYLYSPSTDLTFNAFATAPPLTSVPTRPLRAGVSSDYSLFVVLGQNLTKNKILSPFAEVQVSLMDGKLRLGAEGRYTAETRNQQALASGGNGGVQSVSGALYTAKYNYFTPRFTVDYDLAPSSLLYASAAKGVKSGGFNTTSFLPAYRVYDQDSNWTYELGTKNQWGKLRFNADVFLIKWKNMQIPASDPGNPAALPVVITLNLGNLTSKGVEAELEYAVTSKFTISGTGYYGSATYDDSTFHLNWSRTPAVCDNVVCPTNGNISGNQSPRAPKFMGTLAAEWRDQLSATMDYYVRSDLTYQSRAYADEMNIAWVSPRALVNATVGFTHDNFEIQFWARNLFDKKYLQVASIQQPNVAYNANIGDRRTLGVTVSAKY